MQRYLDIINHFGLRSQMKKLNEETYELLEAIDNYEDLIFENETTDNSYTVEELNIFRDHIVEEMSDVLILLSQFICKYDIKEHEVNTCMDYKLKRTEDRIKSNYYRKGDNND